MPRSIQSNREIREERIETILLSSLSYFVEKSFDDVTYSDLSLVCNVSRGLIYNYFPSKEKIAEALWKRFQTDPITSLRSEKTLDALKSFSLCFAQPEQEESMVLFRLFVLQKDFKAKSLPLSSFPFDVQKIIKACFEQAAREQKIPYGDYEGMASSLIDFLVGYELRLLQYIRGKSKRKQAPQLDVESLYLLIGR